MQQVQISPAGYYVLTKEIHKCVVVHGFGNVIMKTAL